MKSSRARESYNTMYQARRRPGFDLGLALDATYVRRHTRTSRTSRQVASRLGLSGKCELFSAKWKFKMQKNTPKFFQKMQNITQNAGKIRSVAMATKMATVFWTGKLVFL